MDLYQASATDGPRCSVLAGRLDEPLAGTSVVVSTWLCIEQPGPWGREALVESHLEHAVGRELAELSKGTGVRIALIRRPGNHPDRHRPTPHRIYVAHTEPGRAWLERGWVADVKELLDLDFAAVGAGRPSGYGELVNHSLLLVCTNGRRDVCCALLGRPIAAALFATHGEQVWECTHIGGHRFSPTAVVLPHGYSYGRLDVLAAERLLAPDAGVLIERCRGRSTWPAAGQVAELAVRSAIEDRDPDSVRVSDVRPIGDGGWLATVSHVDGRRWAVPVVERRSSELRSASCGAKPTPVTMLDVEGRPELI